MRQQDWVSSNYAECESSDLGRLPVLTSLGERQCRISWLLPSVWVKVMFKIKVKAAVPLVDV